MFAESSGLILPSLLLVLAAPFLSLYFAEFLAFFLTSN